MTINYIEKGAGLPTRIAQQGHWLIRTASGFESDDDAAVQAIIDAYTLTDCQSYAKAQIDALAAAKRNAVVGDTSPAEMAKWQEKYRQAALYQASGNTADCPDLVPEAQARGVTLDALCAKIVAKAQQLSWIEAQIAGVSGRHQDAIGAMTDFASVLAYDFSAGWPV